MSLIDKIFKKEKQKELKLQHGVNTVQNIIEESETQKEAMHKAVSAAVEEIQAHPEMPVGEFLRRLQQNTDLSDADLVKIIKQLPEVKSEEATLAAVKATDLSSPKIAEIIQDTPISPKVAQKIVEQIPDEDIQREEQAKIDQELEKRKKQEQIRKENKILEKLSSLYEDCKDIEAPILVEKVKILTNENRTKKIDKKILDIISKRTALDCMKYGAPRLKTLAGIMPAEDMFEADLPSLAQSEYEILKPDYEEKKEKYKTFGAEKKTLIKNLLLENIAQKSAQTFDELGDFNLPQTEHFKNLSDEDVQKFIDTVKIYSPEIKETDLERLNRQLKGEIGVDEQESNTRIEQIKANETQLREVEKELENINLKIKSFPPSKQLSVAKTISAVLDEQREAFDKWKKIKEGQQLSEYENDEEKG